MPSFLELLEANDVLASVKAEGARRRRRRYRRNLVVGGVALVLAAAPAVALLPGDGDDREEVTVAAEPEADRKADETVRSTTTTVAVVSTETTLATEVLGEVIERPASTPTSRPRPAPTTVPPLVCDNSTDPACGDFFWDPAPAPNQPLALSDPGSLTVAPGAEITIDWSDADAGLAWDFFSTDGVSLGSSCQQTSKFGPWTPPSPRPGSGTLRYTAPMTPGAYTAVVSAASQSGTGSLDCDDPYFSEAQRSFTLIVEDPTTPSS